MPNGVRDPTSAYFHDTEIIRRVVTEQDGRLYYAEWLNAAFGVLVLLGTAAMAAMVVWLRFDPSAAALLVWIPCALLAAAIAVMSAVRRLINESFPLFTTRFRRFVVTEITVYLVVGSLAALLWSSGGARPGVPLLLIVPHLTLLGFYTVGSLFYTAFAALAVAFGLLAFAPATFAALLLDAIAAAALLIASSIQMYRSPALARRPTVW